MKTPGSRARGIPDGHEEESVSESDGTLVVPRRRDPRRENPVQTPTYPNEDHVGQTLSEKDYNGGTPSVEGDEISSTVVDSKEVGKGISLRVPCSKFPYLKRTRGLRTVRGCFS